MATIDLGALTPGMSRTPEAYLPADMTGSNTIVWTGPNDNNSSDYYTIGFTLSAQTTFLISGIDSPIYSLPGFIPVGATGGDLTLAAGSYEIAIGEGEPESFVFQTKSVSPSASFAFSAKDIETASGQTVTTATVGSVVYAHVLIQNTGSVSGTPGPVQVQVSRDANFGSYLSVNYTVGAIAAGATVNDALSFQVGSNLAPGLWHMRFVDGAATTASMPFTVTSASSLSVSPSKQTATVGLYFDSDGNTVPNSVANSMAVSDTQASANISTNVTGQSVTATDAQGKPVTLSAGQISALAAGFNFAYAGASGGPPTSGAINWTYQLSGAALSFMTAGESAVIDTTINLADAAGHSAPAEVAVTVTDYMPAKLSVVDPQQQAELLLIEDYNGAVFSGATAGTIDYTDSTGSPPPTVTSQTHVVSATDASGAAVTLTADQQAALDNFLVSVGKLPTTNGDTGKITWSADADGTRFDFLKPGETVQTETDVTITDAAGKSDTATIDTTTEGGEPEPGVTSDVETLYKAFNSVLGGGKDIADKSIFMGQLLSTIFNSIDNYDAFNKFKDLPVIKKYNDLKEIYKTAQRSATYANDLNNGDVTAMAADVLTNAIMDFADAVDKSALENGVATVETLPGAALFLLGGVGKVGLVVYNKDLKQYVKNHVTQILVNKGFPNPKTSSISPAPTSVPTLLALSTAPAGSDDVMNFTLPTSLGIPTFDPGYYLATYKDAAAAVAAQTYSSALQYYLRVGLARGDIPAQGAAAIDITTIPDLALQGGTAGHNVVNTGIFELALGAMPTDGLSSLESQVGQSSFGALGPVDATLTSLADRYAIDVARNQERSGSKFAAVESQVSATLSNGGLLSALESAAAPGYGQFSAFVVSTDGKESLANVEASFAALLAKFPRPANSGRRYGIAEFGGVWIGVVANAKSGVALSAPVAEANGAAPINFLAGDDAVTLDFGFHSGAAYGSVGDDAFIVGAGADTITGGGGLDTAVFSGARSAYTITALQTGLQVSGPQGVDTLTGVERLVFSDQTVNLGQNSDIFWRNVNGDDALWKSNGAGGFTALNLWSADPSWQVAGVGDFNGDGQADILWRDTSGADAIWQSNGAGGFTALSLWSADPSWRVAGVGDFNGDGKADILWRNANGSDAIWQSSGAGGFTGVGVWSADSSWKVAGVGDFIGDGHADILWRNTSGADAIWQSNGAGGFTGVSIWSADSSWKVADVGDFNGDGKADILWRNTSGADALWESNGPSGFTGVSVWSADPSWQVQKA